MTDNTHFKEWFRQIPLPLVEEIWSHLREMLESGAIWPSQSAWCNTVVLVRKKDRGLWFSINFCHLNAHIKKDSYPLPRIQEVLESLVGAGHFLCLDLKLGFWQIKMEEAWKQYTTFIVDNFGFLECNHMPFGLCNAPATFQRLMQNCLSKLNLIYCLIYLDDIIVFSQMAEEHIHRLHVVFDWFREYNLKLKPSKCSLFKEEINYLAHWVSTEGVQPSDLNLRAIADCAPPQTYIEFQVFLSLIGHYQQFIKGFVHITQPLNGLLSGQGASRKLERVSLPEDALRAFDALKWACMSASVLAFADYTKEFLLETDASKEGLGVVLSQKQVDRQYHPVTYGSRALMAHEKNYHSTKLEFLALKWVVTEHFKEYLVYQPFLVRTDNNPLTYIMTTPNLNTTGHQWVWALARFNFLLEYQKGWDNTVADMLSWITTHLSLEAMQFILDGLSLGATHRAKGYDPVVVEGDYSLEKEVYVTAGWVLVEMYMTDWAKTKREDPILNAVLDWLEAWKKTDLKTLLGEHASSVDGWLVWRNCQNFVIHQKALYLCMTPKGESEDLMLFVVPRVHQVTTLNGHDQDAGHQGYTLSLLQECFWWPGMTSQMQQAIRNCTCCLQHKGGLPKAPLHPIMATGPLDLLHDDFTSIETTLEPNQSPRVTNVLVFQDH